MALIILLPAALALQGQMQVRIGAGKDNPDSARMRAATAEARLEEVRDRLIADAAERLAAEGLIELRHGDGTYVCPRRNESRSELSAQRDKFGLEFDALIQRGVMLGFSDAELRAMLTSALATARKAQQ